MVIRCVEFNFGLLVYIYEINFGLLGTLFIIIQISNNIRYPCMKAVIIKVTQNNAGMYIEANYPENKSNVQELLIIKPKRQN